MFEVYDTIALLDLHGTIYFFFFSGSALQTPKRIGGNVVLANLDPCR